MAWLRPITLKVAALLLFVGSLAPSVVPTGPARAALSGGKVVFRSVAGPDWIDPGLTYYVYGFMLSYAFNRPLYSVSPEQPESPLPDLAESDPVISDDNKTVTVTIKSGVRFSPPVDREVTSADVKYAIERTFTENVPSGYVFTYFSDLVGAPSDRGPLTDISGIEIPDDRTIVFHLETPTATAFVAALVLPITAPVPEEYAEPFDQRMPSRYDSHVVFTGPYMIRNDAEGKLVGLGDDIEIIRNPNWDPSTDFRPAYLDEILIRSGGDATRMATRTLTASHLLCCDFSPIDVVKEFRSTYPDQIASVAAHGTRWVGLNTSVKPLRNLNVRKALVSMMDRRALRRARGGPLAGVMANHFLPPGLPGFEESGGLEGFADIDYTQHPSGDRALAERYMLEARHDGVPITRDGEFAGDKPLLMVGSNGAPSDEVARRVKRQVEKLGFEVDLRLVPPDKMFTRWCGVPAQKVAICPNVAWFVDFLDPQSMLEPTFSGDAIQDEGSNNWSMLDRPAINDAMSQAATLPAGSARSTAWADINRMIVEQAPGIPYMSDDVYALESSDVAGVMNPFYATWDLSFTSVKEL